MRLMVRRIFIYLAFIGIIKNAGDKALSVTVFGGGTSPFGRGKGRKVSKILAPLWGSCQTKVG